MQGTHPIDLTPLILHILRLPITGRTLHIHRILPIPRTAIIIAPILLTTTLTVLMHLTAILTVPTLLIATMYQDLLRQLQRK